jgi:nuclear pore complex protein Nup50
MPSFGTTTSTGTTTSFAASWSTGVFSNNQAPVLFGNQTPAPKINNGADVEEDEDDQQQPSSPSLKKSEEKGIVVVHEVKCKLYVKSSDPADKDTWKDKGTGQLTIKCKEGVAKGTKDSKPTIVVRNDVGRVQLNALLYSGIKTNKQKNSLVAIFHTAADDGGSNDSIVARTFLIRTKTAEDRDNLETAIHEYAPAS